MGASQCKVWYLNCGRQGHAVWVTDIEGMKPPLRVFVDGDLVFQGDHSSVPEHGEILRQPLENSALVVSMERHSKQPSYSLQWDGREYADDLSLLRDKKSTVDMSDTFTVRLKAMEVKMEEAPVREGSTQTKSTAFFTIVANLYTTRHRDKGGEIKSPSSSGQIQICSGVSSHRFSTLLDLHDKIAAYYTASLPDVKMPKPPEKSVKGTSGVSTSDADFIGHRKMAIDRWLQGLVKLPRIVYIPDFVEFFGLPSIRPKYCGGHIVFTQPTSLDSPAHKPSEKAVVTPSDADRGEDSSKEEPTVAEHEPSDSDDEEYVVREPTPQKTDGAFETVDDFDDFDNSPAKGNTSTDEHETYTITSNQEVGLSMFGEQDEEDAMAASAADEEAGASPQSAHGDNAAQEGTSDASSNNAGEAAPQEPEQTPMEKLLQAESKLSLYQQRLEQAEEANSYAIVDELYVEIAKLQKTIFLLQEEAEAYEKANAPTEAELWEDEEDGAIQIEDQDLGLDDTPISSRKMTTGGDEWGDFSADAGDDWGDGGDVNDDDPFGSAAATGDSAADESASKTEQDSADNAFGEDDEWD